MGALGSSMFPIPGLGPRPGPLTGLFLLPCLPTPPARPLFSPLPLCPLDTPLWGQTLPGSASPPPAPAGDLAAALASRHQALEDRKPWISLKCPPRCSRCSPTSAPPDLTPPPTMALRPPTTQLRHPNGSGRLGHRQGPMGKAFWGPQVFVWGGGVRTSLPSPPPGPGPLVHKPSRSGSCGGVEVPDLQPPYPLHTWLRSSPRGSAL